MRRRRNLYGKRSGYRSSSLVSGYAATHPKRATRGYSVGRRRRRSTASLAILLVLVAVVVAFAWLWVRPQPVTVSATPLDATVAFVGKTAVGKLEAQGVRPGDYVATVTRAGFKPARVLVQVQRMRKTTQKVALQPLAQAVEVKVTPASSRIRIAREGRMVAQGKGRLRAKVLSGQITVSAEAPGRNTWTRQIFLDGPLSYDLRLDPKGQLVQSLAISHCSGAPKAVALTPDGTQAWATILDGPPSIEIFEPRSGKRIAGIDLGTHGAVEIVFSKDGRRAYASQMETARVFEIDTAARKVVRSFDTESAWTKVVALSPDEQTLYAANWSGDDVSEIDLGTGKVRRRIPVADTPRGLWPSADGKTLWVASFGTGDLERVDLATGKVKRVFSSGGALRHLVADEKRGLLYASDMAKDAVWVTNMKTGATTRFATVDKKPNTIDLSPDGNTLFVSCRGENNSTSYYLPGPEWGSILLYSTQTRKPLDAIVGGNQCTALDSSADGSVLVFSDFLDNRLRSYEVPSYQQLAAGNGGRFAVYRKELRK